MLAELLLAALPAALPQDGADPPVGRATVYRLDSIETLDGKVLTNATILVREGVIERIGQAVVIPDHARVYDLRGSGSVAMPPLVLGQAGMLRQTTSGGGLRGKIKGIDHLQISQDQMADLREIGVLLLGVEPGGSGIPGRTSVLRTDAEAPIDALVHDLHLKMTLDISKSSKDLLRKALKDADAAIDKEAKAKADWEKARKEWAEKQKAAKEGGKEEKPADKVEKDSGKESSSGRGRGAALRQEPEQEKGKDGDNKGKEQEKGPPETFEPPKIDPNLQPVVEWVRHQRMVQVRLDNAGEWLHWLDVIGKRELPWEVVLVHGGSTNLAEVVDDLVAHQVRIHVPARISTLPSTRIQQNLPALLARAGAERIVLTPTSSGSINAAKDLRVLLADVVREGLDRSVALRAVSVEAAAALGQEDLVAPLAAGAPASFIILDGDPLDPQARVTHLVAAGEILYDRKKAEAAENRE